MADNGSEHLKLCRQRRSRNRKKTKKTNHRMSNVSIHHASENIQPEIIYEKDNGTDIVLNNNSSNKSSNIFHDASYNEIETVKNENKNVLRDSNNSKHTSITTATESNLEWETTDNLILQNEKLNVIIPTTFETVIVNITQVILRDEKFNKSYKNLNNNMIEDKKIRNIKKKDAIHQQSTPFLCSPKVLEVILEENGDCGDKENFFGESVNRINTSTSYESKPLTVNTCTCRINETDETFNKLNTKCASCKASFTNNVTLVKTKLLDDVHINDSNSVSHCQEDLLTTYAVECNSGVEVVYLKDTCNSLASNNSTDDEEVYEENGRNKESLDIDTKINKIKNFNENSKENILAFDELVNETLQSNLEDRKSDCSHESDIKLISEPQNYNKLIEDDLLNQEKKIFLNKIMSALCRLNIDEIHSYANNEEFKNLPFGIKESVITVLNSNRILNTHGFNVDNGKQLSDILKKESDAEFYYEFQAFCDNLNDLKPYERFDKLEETRNKSPGCSSHSSGSMSQCTAIYNPFGSLTNIDVLDDGPICDQKTIQPPTLKECCLQKLLTMPFGSEVIEELASVSVYIKEITNDIYSNLKLPIFF